MGFPRVGASGTELLSFFTASLVRGKGWNFYRFPDSPFSGKGQACSGDPLSHCGFFGVSSDRHPSEPQTQMQLRYKV